MTSSIDHQDLARLIERAAAVVVEALGPDFYADGHLPGAVNLPANASDDAVRAVVATGELAVVVYGSRRGPEAGELAARIETLVGAPVAVLSGGKEGWVEAGLSIERGPDE